MARPFAVLCVLTMDSGNYYASLRLAIALRMQGKLSQAEQVNTSMLGLYPTDVSFLTQLGLVHVGQKNRAAARQVFRKVLTLDPENVVAKKHASRQQLASTRTRPQWKRFLVRDLVLAIVTHQTENAWTRVVQAQAFVLLCFSTNQSVASGFSSACGRSGGPPRPGPPRP